MPTLWLETFFFNFLDHWITLGRGWQWYKPIYYPANKRRPLYVCLAAGHDRLCLLKSVNNWWMTTTTCPSSSFQFWQNIYDRLREIIISISCLHCRESAGWLDLLSPHIHRQTKHQIASDTSFLEQISQCGYETLYFNFSFCFYVMSAVVGLLT